MILQKISALIMLIVLEVSAFYFIRRSQTTGEVPKLRRLAPIDAMEEALGRCAEMGRPVHFSPGRKANLQTYETPQTMAGISVLSYITRIAARLGVKPIATLAVAQTVPLVTEKMRESYLVEGKGDEFDPVESVRYIAQSYQGLMAGQMGLIQREKPQANILIGPYSAECLPVLEEGKKVGAINIGGTARLVQLHFFAVACDYTLFSEEVYAAGAYLSGDPIQTSSLVGQDVGKLLSALLFLLATLALTFGSDIILNLLKK